MQGIQVYLFVNLNFKFALCLQFTFYVYFVRFFALAKLFNKNNFTTTLTATVLCCAHSGCQTIVCFFTFLLCLFATAILIGVLFLISPPLRHTTIGISIRFGHMLELMIPTTGETVIRKAFKALQQISVDRIVMFVIVVSGGRVMQIRWNRRCCV